MSKNKKVTERSITEDASIASSLFVANEVGVEVPLVPIKDANLESLQDARRIIANNELGGHGFYAEVHHPATNNIKSSIVGNDIHATRLGSTELGSPDIGSSTGDLFNAKFCATPNETLRALISKPEYDGQIGLVPADQLPAIESLRVQWHQAALESGDINLAERLARLQVTDHVGNSEPLSYFEAREGAEGIRHGDMPDWADSYGFDDLGERSLEAAGLSLVVDLAPQIASDVSAALRGEKSIGEVSARLFTRVKERGGKAALASGVKAAASGGLSYFDELDPTGATLIVTLSYEVGKHAIAFRNGEITLEEFKRLSTKSIIEKGSSVILTSTAVALLGPVGFLTPFIVGKLTSDAKQRQQLTEALRGCFDEAQETIRQQLIIVETSQRSQFLAAESSIGAASTVSSSNDLEQSSIRIADRLREAIAQLESEANRIEMRRHLRNEQQ